MECPGPDRSESGMLTLAFTWTNDIRGSVKQVPLATSKRGKHLDTECHWTMSLWQVQKMDVGVSTFARIENSSLQVAK